MNGEAVVLGFDTSCYTTSVAGGGPGWPAGCQLPPLAARSQRGARPAAERGRVYPCASVTGAYGGIGSAHPRLHYCSGVRFDTTPG